MDSFFLIKSQKFMSKLNNPILKIFIKGIYFDEIIAQTKITEYRKVAPFWTSRHLDANNKKRHYDQIEFINGYKTDSRRVITGYEGFRKKGEEYLIGIRKIIKKNFKQ